jgi:hypothetical protein
LGVNAAWAAGIVVDATAHTNVARIAGTARRNGWFPRFSAADA